MNVQDLPEYVCHKRVRAAKIKAIDPEIGGRGLEIHLEGRIQPVIVDNHWAAKHEPEVGGYFVAYADGYQSYSPAQAFEEGYTRASAEGPGAGTADAA